MPLKFPTLSKIWPFRMRYNKYYSSLLLVVVAALAVSSCTRNNGIDNNKVIRTPYTVLFIDNAGVPIRTNDGVLFTDMNGPQGSSLSIPKRAITPSGNSNIIYILKNLFVNTDNGKSRNWNARNFNVNPACNWASMLLDVPAHSAVYLASTQGNGVEFSIDNGSNWQTDTRFSQAPGASIQSFAFTPAGQLYGLDATGAGVYVLPNQNAGWSQVGSSPGFPASNAWYLTNFNNTLVAADRSGPGGVYHSDDNGNTWSAFTGIPGNQEILSCAAPLGQTLLAGTDSAGIYRLVGNNFVPSNNGLEPFTSVYGITGKQDTYKSGVIKRYVYITTSRGLYRSEDLGQNWISMKPGDLRAIW